MNKTILIIVLIPFTILTGLALWHDGILGIFASIIGSYGSAQIYVDLVIAIAMLCVWMWQDAKSVGRNPWPWIVALLPDMSI